MSSDHTIFSLIPILLCSQLYFNSKLQGSGLHAKLMFLNFGAFDLLSISALLFLSPQVTRFYNCTHKFDKKKIIHLVYCPVLVGYSLYCVLYNFYNFYFEWTTDYTDCLSPFTGWATTQHDMLRFYDMFFECHLTATCCI